MTTTLGISGMFIFTEPVPYNIFLLSQVTDGKMYNPGTEIIPAVIHQQHLFVANLLIGLKWLLRQSPEPYREESPGTNRHTVGNLCLILCSAPMTIDKILAETEISD